MTESKPYTHVTTEAAVAIYRASGSIFGGLLKEVRLLSNKKPDATLSEGKVTIINRVLTDLLGILQDEPEGKYLELLNDKTLPQVSDAVLMMVQFETALGAFRNRYYRDYRWVTKEPPSRAEDDEDDDIDGLEDDDDTDDTE